MAQKKSRFRQEAGAADDLTERTEQSYNTRESSGKYNDYFTDDMPLTKWQCTEAGHILDVIPFIAGDNHPNVGPGKATHNVDVYVHFGIGVTESAYLCPARMGRGKCPICEFQAELKKQKNYDEEYVKSFNAKRRVVYNVCVYDTHKDEDAGVMLWEASHHLSEKNIMAIARNNRTGAFVKWADPDDGMTIEFARKGKGKNTDYEGFKFTVRDEPITDETLDDAIAIDDYLKYLTYEELAEVLGDPGGGEEAPLEETYEEATDRKPSREGRTSRVRNEDPPENKKEEPASRRSKRTEPEPDPEPDNGTEEDPPKRRSRRSTPENKQAEAGDKAETGTTLSRRRRR
jgi:hypothetical protein